MGLISAGSHLKDVLFTGNEAIWKAPHISGVGGGLYTSHAPATLEEVRFVNNHAQITGGGMHSFSSYLKINNSSFVGNTATEQGGGMFNKRGLQRMMNVSFLGNSAISADGGGLYNDNSAPELTNVLISGNSAGFDGGGMLNYNSRPVLINVTVSGNHARNHGGGLANVGVTVAVEIKNSIIWNNSVFNGFGSPAITNSDIENCGGSSAWNSSCGTDNGNNIDLDPLFIIPVNPANAPTTTGNLHLRRGSPAIDTGDNNFNNEWTDLAGDERRIDGDGNGSVIIDMGAYEYSSYIVNTTTDTDDGACNTSHCSLREAINAANTNPARDSTALTIVEITYPTARG